MTYDVLVRFMEWLRTNSIHTPMEWTNEKPTKPGWYWWRDREFSLSGRACIRYLSSMDMDVNWGDTCEWAGPLPQPTERKEA